jgi:hypothetical protein
MLQRQKNRGSIISFYGAISLEEQRAYIWGILSQSNLTALYIDWEHRISRYSPPPILPHVLCTSLTNRSLIIELIEQVITKIPVRILIFDPFVLFDSTSVGWMYTKLRTLIRTHDITLYLLIDPDRISTFQAEVYIDLRR